MAPKGFVLEENGTFSTSQNFDFEIDDKNYSITVSASDDQNATTLKEFVFNLQDVAEAPIINNGLDSFSLNFREDAGSLEPNGWDLTLGGEHNEFARKVIANPDGSYLLIGSSDSNGTGDRSEETRGLTDGWVVKVTAKGVKSWEKSYGGSDRDYLYDGAPTDDGGYLLAGYSQSDASAEKSANSKGGYDYWVVKIDSRGNKIWDKTLGGDKNEYFRSLTETDDGGYLLAGYSDSNGTGDKTQLSQGSFDYWLVKIDKSGNKIWDKTFGGSGNDSLHSSSVISFPDGGFLMIGVSYSSKSGDKSENSKGGSDFWAVRIDKNGIKLWDKTFGGSGTESSPTVLKTIDGGIIIAGSSSSGSSGDKSDETKGSNDIWIVKIDNSGNKLWDKSLGGDQHDWYPMILNSANGGYLVAGHSSSTLSGDKSSDSIGGYDYWLVRIAENGEKIWDKVIGGSGSDMNPYVVNSIDGGYLIAGNSGSSTSGDKSEDAKGGNDMWAIKISAEGKTESPVFARDGDNDLLTWSLLTAPSNGVANVSGNGPYPTTLFYTPNANFHGADSFVIQVSDGDLNDTITVNVEVQGINDAPSAPIMLDGNLSMDENISVGSTIAQFSATDVDGDTDFNFSVSVFPEFIAPENTTAWFDATDRARISASASTGELISWINKVDPDTKLVPHSVNKPIVEGIINGRPAITFTKRSDNNMEHVTGVSGTSTGWNPFGLNGATSGTLSDTAVFLVYRIDTARNNLFPFNNGWAGHLTWSNGYLYWDNGNRIVASIGTNQAKIIHLYKSVSEGIREIWVNGSKTASGTPNASTISGSFLFPSNVLPSSAYGSDITLGEIIVLNGTMSEPTRQMAEGYLAGKWGWTYRAIIQLTSHPMHFPLIKAEFSG